MSDLDWFSTGTSFNGSRETFVRAWEPGDGLRCSCSNYQRKTPCGEPVAVIKDVLLGQAGKWEKQSVTRVLCLRHLANQFADGVGTQAEGNVERKALEELAERYWDQFQHIQQRLTDELLEARFSCLPNGLRERVIEIAKQDAS